MFLSIFEILSIDLSRLTPPCASNNSSNRKQLLSKLSFEWSQSRTFKNPQTVKLEPLCTALKTAPRERTFI